MHVQHFDPAQDRVGNTPLHLAMESGHGDAAVLLIKKGADRGRVRSSGCHSAKLMHNV